MFIQDNMFVRFSDAAKFADVARNILFDKGFNSSFNFWGYNSSDWIQPAFVNSIVISFKFLGITDFAVIVTSLFYFLVTIIFTYLLTNNLIKNRAVTFFVTIVVGVSLSIINYATSGASESMFIAEIVVALYLLSLRNKWSNLLSVLVLILMYFTRPQAVIYIFGIILFYLLISFKIKKAIIYFLTSFVLGSVAFFLLSNQGVVATTQNLPGIAVSDSLRGVVSGPSIIDIFKKIFYNLYNFYKALPEILNPYLFTLFVVGLFSWSKNKLLNSFKIASLFMVLATFFVTALTIPFYRYIHPIIPLVYIIAIVTLYEIVEYFVSRYEIIKNKKIFTGIITTCLVLLFAVGQTVGYFVLDSRFERKIKNVDKPPIYVLMSWKLKEITNKDQVILTNLDTWGSWYGERKTIWFPVEPEMVLPEQERIDAIYLTTYKMDDENYYMGDSWRELFENPETQTILPNYKFVGEYEFSASDNYERESGKAVLLVKN